MTAAYFAAKCQGMVQTLADIHAGLMELADGLGSADSGDAAEAAGGAVLAAMRILELAGEACEGKEFAP